MSPRRVAHYAETSFAALAAGAALYLFASRALWDVPQRLALGAAGTCHALAWGLALWGAWRAPRGQGAVWRQLLGHLALAGAGLVALRALIAPSVGWLHALVGAPLQVAATALLAYGLASGWACSRAYRQGEHAPTLDIARIRGAAAAPRLVLWSLMSFAACNYAAVTYAHKWDLSYFRASQVSERTAQMVAALNQTVEITLFFPPGNDVHEQVQAYCNQLAQASSWLKIRHSDWAMEPALARTLQVRQNGVVAVRSGNQTETLTLGLDVEAARAVLRRLDQDIYQRLSTVLRPAAVVYLTQGHAERSEPAPGAPQGLVQFRQLLERQGFVLKPLGLAQGLGNKVPADAAAVAIMGPLHPFSPAERAALHQYLEAGGHMLVALDPERSQAEDALLAPLGVTVDTVSVGNPHYQVRAEGQGPSPYNLVTQRVQSHPTVRSLERAAGRMALVLLGAAAVQPAQRRDAALVLTPTVLAMPDSYRERLATAAGPSARSTTEPLSLAYAIERPNARAAATMRAAVVGDVDFVSDGVLTNPANSLWVSDTLQWLVHGVAAGVQSFSNEDVPLILRKQDDTLWFYGVIVGIPLGVLALGYLLGHRSGRASRLRRSRL
jgi:hypothetical protein